jgi:hypothetical protein
MVTRKNAEELADKLAFENTTNGDDYLTFIDGALAMFDFLMKQELKIWQIETFEAIDDSLNFIREHLNKKTNDENKTGNN